MLERFYQLGYVAADLEGGMAALSAQYGVARFSRIGDGKGTSVTTPQGNDIMLVQAAVARVGRLPLK